MWRGVAKQRRLNVREEEYIGKEERNRGSEVSKEASQRFHQPELSKKSSGRISNYCRKTPVFHFLALSYLFLVISIPYKVHSSTFTVPISKSSDQQISEEHHLSINKKKSIQTPKTKALINSRGIGDSMVPSTFGTDRVGSDSSNNTSSTPGSNTASLNENETREIVEEDINSKENNIKFYGPHADVRSKLDYSYHSYYDESRTKLQDEIIAELLGSVVIQDSVHKNLQCSTPASNPWITFTAGAMGAGKTHTIRELVRHDLFPLDAFVIVDPDEIRRHLPEFPRLLEESPELAGEITRKEAGYISEILTWVALNHGYNVLVDGSLRDHEWYKEYFQSLRDSYPRLNIAIIHITAPREAVIHRAMKRGLETGRIVPLETLELALEQVPQSVRILSPLVDFFCELSNGSEESSSSHKSDNDPISIELSTEGVTWESFRMEWEQQCLLNYDALSSHRANPDGILRASTILNANNGDSVSNSLQENEQLSENSRL